MMHKLSAILMPFTEVDLARANLTFTRMVFFASTQLMFMALQISCLMVKSGFKCFSLLKDL